MLGVFYWFMGAKIGNIMGMEKGDLEFSYFIVPNLVSCPWQQGFDILHQTIWSFLIHILSS